MATEMENVIDQNLEEGYSQEVNPASIYLKNRAHDFLEDIKEIYERIIQINMMEARRNQLKNQVKSLQKKMADVKNASNISSLSHELLMTQNELDSIRRTMITQAQFNMFSSKVFQFQKDLNEFIDQQAKTVFVYTDSKNNITLYELTAEGAQSLRGELASRGGGVTGRYRFSKRFLENSDNAKKMEAENLKFSLSGLQKAYQTSLERGRHKKSERKKGGLLIFWQPSGKGWRKIFVSSAGDLAESYAAYFIANLSSPDFKDSYIENLLDQYLLGDSYTYNKNIDEYISTDSRSAQQVDNISGLLEGDVSAKQGEKSVEYAIKAAGASMLSYEQIISLARTIDSMPVEEITKAYVRSVKQKLHDAGHTRNVASAVDGCIEDTWEEMIDKYLLSEKVSDK